MNVGAEPEIVAQADLALSPVLGHRKDFRVDIQWHEENLLVAGSEGTHQGVAVWTDIPAVGDFPLALAALDADLVGARPFAEKCRLTSIGIRGSYRTVIIRDSMHRHCGVPFPHARSVQRLFVIVPPKT